MSILKFIKNRALWIGLCGFSISAGLAFLVYIWSLAPNLTWAYHGADGGEFLAAAVTNGVPHPPGYPLYILLLQGWLTIIPALIPGQPLAWYGNLFSAFWAIMGVGSTMIVLNSFLRRFGHGNFRQKDLHCEPETRTRVHVPHQLGTDSLNWLLALLVSFCWAFSPLFWEQALITEVYTLHMALLVVAFGLTFASTPSFWRFAAVVGMGLANHLTFFFFLPALFYYQHTSQSQSHSWFQRIGTYVLGGLIGGLFYLRIPFVASAADGPPPINWGYADNWQGFWWLISGAAYQQYLLDGTIGTILVRLAAWAYILTAQFTPIGLALLLIGLAYLDRYRPTLRNFSLLWILPISLYAIVYHTRDSQVYLLPVIWLSALWLCVGIQDLIRWVEIRWGDGPPSTVGRKRTQRVPALGWGRNRADSSLIVTVYLFISGFASYLRPRAIVLVGAFLALISLVAFRFPTTTLQDDSQAENYLNEVASVLAPDSILISGADQETFAFWYAQWGSQQFIETAPNLILINHSLYVQFPWYRRLVTELYPDIAGIGDSFESLLAKNQGICPIYFSEQLPAIPAERLYRVGVLWRYQEE